MSLSIKLFSILLFLISGNLLAMETKSISKKLEKIEERLEQLEEYLKLCGNEGANDQTAEQIESLEIRKKYLKEKLEYGIGYKKELNIVNFSDYKCRGCNKGKFIL